MHDKNLHNMYIIRYIDGPIWLYIGFTYINFVMHAYFYCVKIIFLYFTTCGGTCQFVLYFVIIFLTADRQYAHYLEFGRRQ
jgi:hypothetical protein